MYFCGQVWQAFEFEFVFQTPLQLGAEVTKNAWCIFILGPTNCAYLQLICVEYRRCVLFWVPQQLSAIFPRFMVDDFVGRICLPRAYLSIAWAEYSGLPLYHAHSDLASRLVQAVANNVRSCKYSVLLLHSPF